MNQMPHYYMGYVLTFVKKRGEKRIKSLVLDQQLGLENRSAFVHGQCVCVCVCVRTCTCVIAFYLFTAPSLTYNINVTVIEVSCLLLVRTGVQMESNAPVQ